MAYEKKKKSHSLLKALLLLSVLLPLLLSVLASTLGRQEFSLPHRLSFESFGFVQSMMTKTVGFFEGGWNHYLNLVNVQQDNDELRLQIKKYKALNAEFREAVAVNVRLSKLLDLEEAFETPTLTAQIIGRDPSIWFKTLTINKGSSFGVEKGMPVTTFEGVVGQVVNVSPNYAKVLLATDPNSAIDALVQENRAQGIVKGDGVTYNLNYVLKNSEVTEGDHVVTSGMGGVFPKGLPVGQVAVVMKSKRGMFQKISVTPAVKFRELEYVTIILKADSLAE